MLVGGSGMALWDIVIIAIFLTILGILITEKLDKTVVTLIGAVITAVILNFVEHMPFEEIVLFIDFPTIMIIFGVLVAGNVMNDSGLFQWLAIKLVKLTKGDITKIFILLTMLTVILSSVLTILVAAIVVFQITNAITKALNIDPKPFLTAEAVMISIGGTTSLIASPASIIIAEFAHLSFVFFTIYTMPIGILLGLIHVGIFIHIFHKRMTLDKEVTQIIKDVLLEFDEWSVVPDKKLFYASLVCLIGMIVGFVVFPEPHLVAFTSGLIFLLIGNIPFHRISKEVEWEDIFFFIGIFIIIGGVEHTGILHEIGLGLSAISGGNPLIPLMIIVWFTGVTSGFLDEVTIALTFLPIITTLIEASGFEIYATIFMIALILSTNLGGCLTPIGTPANLLILSKARKEGTKITFTEFLRLGTIIVTINLIIESLYIVALYLLA